MSTNGPPAPPAGYRMRVIGIDPGRHGGLAEIVAGRGPAEVSRVAAMPWKDVGRTRPVVDLDALAAFLDEGVDNETVFAPDLVVVEEMGYRPGDASRAFAMSELNREYGKVVGFLIGRGYRTHEVLPRLWIPKLTGDVKHPPLPAPAEKGRPTAAERRALKKAQADRTKRTKAAVLDRVLRRYPDRSRLILPRCRVPSDGVVDAVALAHHGLTHVLLAAPAA